MKRNSYTIALLLSLLFSCLEANAYDFSADNADGITIYYNVLKGNACEVAAGDYMYCQQISVPETVEHDGKTLRVEAIGGDAFMGCERITAVVLPKGLKTIGSFAFSCCKNLSSINIPESLEIIGTYAFSGCAALKSFALPKSVTTIGDFAFHGCKNLSAFTIAGELKTVGYNALTETAWWNSQPAGMVYIGDILLGCRGDIPKSCSVKEGTRLVANGAFYNACSLNWVELPQSVEAIGSSAFYGCTGLTSIILPKAVKSIGEYTFFNCSNLVSIVLPENLESISWYAFSGCSALVSIVLPEGVSEIGAEAFRGCANLVSIISHRTLPPASYANAFNGVIKSACTLYVQEDAANSYKSAIPWCDFQIMTPETESGFERCATPTISVNNGQLSIESDTHGATCHYTITSVDMQSSDLPEGKTVGLSGQYNISAYAKAEGMLNSDIATAILVWVNPDQEYDYIDLAQKKPVVLRIEDNHAILCGTDNGEDIVLYSSTGAILANMKATYPETRIPYNLQKSQVYIIRYANRSIKFLY